MDKKCPGTDSRFVKVEIHKCNTCGTEVEIFSDELRVKCPQCKNDVYRDSTPSCIDWCKFARQCLGEDKWRRLKQAMDEKQDRVDVREKLLTEMKSYFDSDIRRIQHAEKVLAYAEQILSQEKGDRAVIIPAAILHDIGIKVCEQKYKSTDGQLQEKEGPPVAREIMVKLNIRPEIIDEVSQIIASHHSPGELQTQNFKIIWDADWLVNIKDECDFKDKTKLSKTIDKIFLTVKGKEIAQQIYLDD